jgi:2-hydroxychromene-2-carboxylate isomerase
MKARYKRLTEEAMEKGVFGSPYIVVDGEPFWGSDRLWMVEKWLADGGW